MKQKEIPKVVWRSGGRGQMVWSFTCIAEVTLLSGLFFFLFFLLLIKI